MKFETISKYVGQGIMVLGAHSSKIFTHMIKSKIMMKMFVD